MPSPEHELRDIADRIVECDTFSLAKNRLSALLTYRLHDSATIITAVTSSASATTCSVRRRRWHRPRPSLRPRNLAVVAIYAHQHENLQVRASMIDDSIEFLHTEEATMTYA